MRILHVISGLRASAGGTVAALTGLALAQKHAGADVSIVASFIAPEAAEADALRQRGLRIHQIGPCRDPMSRHPDIAPMLRRLVGEHDIVHIHGLWEQIQHEAAKASRVANVPYVFSPHGMLDPWSLSQGKWKKKIYLVLRLKRDLNRASAMHYATLAERDLAAPLKLKPQTIVEPFGVDLSEFQSPPSRGSFRDKHSIARDARVVLFLSRLHPKKGLDLLIPAAARVLGKDDRLVLAGRDEDGYQRQVEQMLCDAAMTDRAIFTGWLSRSERLSALTDADLMALPSYQENFGMIAIESLAAGCPILISDQVNLWREIDDAKLGSVVPPRVEPLADAMKKMLDDAALRRDIASRGPSFVQEHFSWPKIAARWLITYESMQANPGQPA